MKLKNKMMATAVALVASVGLAGCGGAPANSTVSDGCKPAHTFPTLSEGTLTVVSFDLPPFSKVEGNKLTGIDGEILAKIAAMECLTLTVKPAATAAVIPTAQAGRADLAAGDWYRTAERAKVVALSDPIYLDEMGLVSKDGVSSIPDVKAQGLTLGSADGYLWVEDLKNYLGSSMKTYATGLNCYQDLEAGRVDVCTDSVGAGNYSAKGKDLKVVRVQPFQDVTASVEAAQSTFPIPMNKPELLKAINEDIFALRGSGELADILAKHGLDASAAEPGEPRLIG